MLLLNLESSIKLKVKFSGLIPELARLVTQGDRDKDSEGRIKGWLRTIISNRPSDIQILTVKENKFITVQNPNQKDIIAILDLICNEKNGILYFRDYPIKVGNMIIFTTDIYSISGIIIGLEN